MPLTAMLLEGKVGSLSEDEQDQYIRDLSNIIAGVQSSRDFTTCDRKQLLHEQFMHLRKSAANFLVLKLEMQEEYLSRNAFGEIPEDDPEVRRIQERKSILETIRDSKESLVQVLKIAA